MMLAADVGEVLCTLASSVVSMSTMSGYGYILETSSCSLSAFSFLAKSLKSS